MLPQYARDPGEQAAAAHGNEHRIDVSELCRDFDAAACLSGDDGRIVVRRQVGHAVLLRVLAGVHLGVEAVGAEEAHVAAVSADRIDLGRCGVLGYEDDARDVELLHRVGNGRAVIAARSGDAARGALPGAQRHDPVGRTAQLERPRVLQVLEFEMDVRPRALAVRRRVVERRLAHDARDAGRGLDRGGGKLNAVHQSRTPAYSSMTASIAAAHTVQKVSMRVNMMQFCSGR